MIRCYVFDVYVYMYVCMHVYTYVCMLPVCHVQEILYVYMFPCRVPRVTSTVAVVATARVLPTPHSAYATLVTSLTAHLVFVSQPALVTHALLLASALVHQSVCAARV